MVKNTPPLSYNEQVAAKKKLETVLISITVGIGYLIYSIVAAKNRQEKRYKKIVEIDKRHYASQGIKISNEELKELEDDTRLILKKYDRKKMRDSIGLSVASSVAASPIAYGIVGHYVDKDKNKISNRNRNLFKDYAIREIKKTIRSLDKLEKKINYI